METVHLIVLIKEVPDMEQVKFDSERGTINRASAKAEINPFDRNALQAAVNLKKELLEQGRACHITALTMGPQKAEETLRDVYARGADRCILLTDRRFGGADTLATSRTLAAAIHNLGEYDVVLCGEKTVDGDTAQVGPEVAELLGIPHCCYAESLSISEEYLEVTTGEICGSGQVRQMNRPALVSVTKNIATPVLPTLKRKLESRKAEMIAWSYEEIAGWVEETDIGSKGSPTKVAKIEVPKEETRTCTVFDHYSSFSPIWRQTIREYI